MKEYLDNNKPMGKNVRELFLMLFARISIPEGAGMAAGISVLTDIEKMRSVHREALTMLENTLASVKQATDNPYGDDDEKIAGEILRRIGERKRFWHGTTED